MTDYEEKVDVSCYQTIVEQFPASLYVWHLDNLFDETSMYLIASNTKAERLTTISNEKAIGKTILDVMTGMRGKQYPTLFKQVIVTKHTKYFGIIEYGDDRIPRSFYKLMAFPLPSNCVGMVMEDIGNKESAMRNRKEEFYALIELLDCKIDIMMMGIRRQRPEPFILCKIFHNLINFYTTNESSVADNMAATDFKSVIDRLLSDNYQSYKCRLEFLLTFRYFTTPSILLHVLILRFLYQQQTKMDKPIEIEQTQLRIVIILKLWLERCYYDFTNNSKLIQTLRLFVESAIGCSPITSVVEWKYPLLLVLEEQSLSFRLTSCVTIPPIRPHKTDGACEPLNFRPTVIAEQLTLLQSERFQQIKSCELFNNVWSKYQKELDAPNISALVTLSNRISNWVISQIVCTFDHNTRAQYLKLFIETAHECLTIQNFDSVFAITLALHSPPVSRLQNSWKLLDVKTTKMWDRLNEVTDPSKNYKRYRDKLKEIIDKQRLEPERAPVLPFIALYLKDLTFIEEGNQSLKNFLINYETLIMMAARVRELLYLQQSSFTFAPVLALKAFMMYDMTIVDEEKQYENSRICFSGEPSSRNSQEPSSAASPVNTPMTSPSITPKATPEVSPVPTTRVLITRKIKAVNTSSDSLLRADAKSQFFRLKKVDSKDELAKSFERVFVTVGKKELDIANLTPNNSAPVSRSPSLEQTGKATPETMSPKTRARLLSCR